MSEKRDYYEILSVSKNASDEQIKSAFRKKALEYHPDRNKSKDAESKFKEVNEAYQILSDSEKRSKYDQFGHAGVSGASGGAGFEGFGGFEGVIKGKSEMFEYLTQNYGHIILNNDDKIQIKNCKGDLAITFGQKKDSEFVFKYKKEQN